MQGVGSSDAGVLGECARCACASRPLTGRWRSWWRAPACRSGRRTASRCSRCCWPRLACKRCTPIGRQPRRQGKGPPQPEGGSPSSSSLQDERGIGSARFPACGMRCVWNAVLARLRRAEPRARRAGAHPESRSSFLKALNVSAITQPPRAASARAHLVMVPLDAPWWRSVPDSR